ncbi:putative glutamine amidotransferase [Homoserinimonas aerilata]|uniref:Putative glutamine amidotransferase n=1 Tax=Homoserinimonas aerilata TaxID=1162970 RepID=A0A542YAR0_9MICO|nr:gamma-glutamyl-gamma-aminobutyrate hydrolase family protein [Homoserinimonas aerilata]TQL45044.1 putative glutamine amidotransferase [Homoserinimonas aerilata]
MSQRPQILASYSMDAEAAPLWLRELLHTLARTAADALDAAGADVTFVDPARSVDDPKLLAASVDGVLVLGGADVDPALYGQKPVDGLYGVDARADAFELALIAAAMESGTPVLGICRGMQLLNVARGGTLVQDLGPGTIHRDDADGQAMPEHEVRVLPGTRLGGIFSADALTIRSGHHQAVDTLGGWLRVSAQAPDGTIEAIEAPDSWTLGVQWHPEDPRADAAQLAALMTEFVAGCAASRDVVSAVGSNG